MLLHVFCCILCDCEMIDSQSGEDRQGGRCPLGHSLCAECTTQYVEKTLVGTVWWDRIKCVIPECAEYLQGMSVQRGINNDLLTSIDAAQLRVVPSIGPEAKRERECAAEMMAVMARSDEDRASGATVANTTKACPNCNAPSVLEKGCKHVGCDECKHEYCFECGCDWVSGHLSVSCIPR